MLEHLAGDNETEGPTSISTMISEDKQYLTAIFDTVFISYVCRHKDCGFYGANSDWVKETNHYRFRCPRCARRYRPWVDRQGASELYPFQKVLSIIDPLTQRTLMLPTTWPDSQSDDFLCNQAVIEARKIISDGDADAESRFKANANECLHNLLKKIGLPPTMQHYKEILPTTRDILLSAKGFGDEAVAHLAANGYRGAILPTDIDNERVFNSWEVLTSGLASLILNLPTSLRAYIRETDLFTPAL